MKKPKIVIGWRNGQPIYVPFGGASTMLIRGVQIGILHEFTTTDWNGYAGWKLKQS